MIERALADIVEADLLQLIGRGRTEGRRLDFKRDLPGGGESEVREFLADVTSFANTDGGDIVIGMEEDGNYVVHAQIGDDPRIARAWSYNHRRGYVDHAWIIGGVRNGRH